MEPAWYSRSVQDVFVAVQTSEQGLRQEEAQRRLSSDGPNTLPEAKPDTVPLIFLRQFKSPLIYLLIAASIAVFAMGEVVDGLIILVVLLFNAVVGTIQEGKAQHTLLALRDFASTNATVVRDGKEIVLNDVEVVRGDIIVLREGEKVPADARLISVRNLKIDEASLTGESEPVGKRVEAIEGESVPPAEQLNMVCKGTTVVAGSARAVVVATGVHTAIGAIAAQMSVIDADIPLKANIRALSRAIIGAVVLMGIALLALGLYRGESAVTIFATVVSLAVSVIPEGLPIVITLVLASGVWRMSKHHALVKKLQAVEALGQARVIAVDKTGTITKNELVVREVYTNGTLFTIGGIGYEPTGSVETGGAVIDAANHPELLLAGKLAALNASARVSYIEEEGRWRVSGDPTEAALRVFAEKIGFAKEVLLGESPLIAELPFDYALKYHATLHAVAGKGLLVIEGAPEAVLERCTHVYRDGARRSLRVRDRQELETVLAEMSERGLRVVGSAMRERASEGEPLEAVHGLTFVGFAGMQDAMRPEVAGAMARAEAAGIKVVMITGDHKLTARAIARDAGIWKEGDHILTGAEIEEMSDAQLSARLPDVSVFARVTPAHKLRIVNAYRHRKEIIAMTGDGVNDAPSLVAADLGVAMGKIGTEVAKEAADIVLLDDDFGTIVVAVEEGRSIYKTIKKVMLYLFSTNLGEVLTILAALVLDLPLPLLAAQIIWLNFVTDGFLDVALAMEPKEKGLLSGRFAHPNRFLVDGLMVGRMLLMALPMMIGTLFLFNRYLGVDPVSAWTVSLTVLAVFQWFNAWNCRSETESLFRMDLLSNKYLIGATLIIIVLQLAAVYTPFLQSVLHTVALGPAEWLLIVPIAASVVVVEEARKALHRAYLRRKVARA